MSLYLLKQSDVMWNIKCANAQIVPVGTNSALFFSHASVTDDSWFPLRIAGYVCFVVIYITSQLYDQRSQCGGVNKPHLALARKHWIFSCLSEGFCCVVVCLARALCDIYLNTHKGLEVTSQIKQTGKEEMWSWESVRTWRKRMVFRYCH